MDGSGRDLPSRHPLCRRPLPEPTQDRPLGQINEDTPAPAIEQWAWLEAELRLVVARAAGLDAVSTLDPRINGALASAARLPERRLVDLLDLAAEQFAELNTQPRAA